MKDLVLILKLLLILIFILLNLPFLNAQDDIQFGFESGPSIDFHSIAKGQGELLKSPLAIGSLSGIKLDYQWSSSLSIGSGIYFNFYRESIRFDSNAQIPSRPGQKFWQIPIHLNYDLHMDNQWSFRSSLGYILALNGRLNETQFGDISEGTEQDNVSASWVSQYNFNAIYHLLEAGVSVQHHLKSNILFFLGLKFLYGFDLVSNTGIKYVVNNSTSRFARIESRGNKLVCTAGFSFPLRINPRSTSPQRNN